MAALGASLREVGGFVWSEAALVLGAALALAALLGWLLAEMLVAMLQHVFDPPPDHLAAPVGLPRLALAGAPSWGALAAAAVAVARRSAGCRSAQYCVSSEQAHAMLIVEDDAELREASSPRPAARRGSTIGSRRDRRASCCAGSKHEPPDLLVVDIGLPDADGRDVCQALRARGIQAPVLFLTARDALVDRLAGFERRRRRLPHQAVRLRRARRTAAGARSGARAPTGRSRPADLRLDPWRIP